MRNTIQQATAKVAQSLFHMATVDKNVAAAIFWMKARAGWREKHEIQLSAKPLDQLSDAELEAIIRQKLDVLDLAPEPVEPVRGIAYNELD